MNKINEEMRKNGLVYEWGERRAKEIKSDFPRKYTIEKIINDLFATGFTNHFLGDANMAVTFFPMLMYSLIRCNHLEQILEIGIYKGYSSYYLARGAIANGGHYYGIDIDPRWCKYVSGHFIERDIPHTIICANTKEIKKDEFQGMLGFPKIDFAFLDGEHNTEAVLNEIELIYPFLVASSGLICLHDVFTVVAGAWAELKDDKRFETLLLPLDNGLGIIRKIEGLESPRDYAKKVEVKKLGCQMGETIEEMEGRHKKGDFYTDYVNSPSHDEQMKREHPEMAGFPDFDRLKEREKRYPSK